MTGDVSMSRQRETGTDSQQQLTTVSTSFSFPPADVKHSLIDVTHRRVTVAHTVAARCGVAYIVYEPERNVTCTT